MSIRRGFTVGALLLAVSALAVPSEADIIFEQLGGGTGNNVLFQCPAVGGDPDCAADLVDDDLTLIGTVQNTTFQSLFTANVNVQPGGSGQATIEEVNTATVWTTLDMEWVNFDTTDLVILRVKPTTDGTTIVLTACDNLGDCSWTSFPDFTGIDAPSGDFFRVRTEAGQRIVSVGVAASNGSLSEVEQVRLGNLFIGDDVVAPEPAALALFGMGLLAVGFRARRNRTQ
jgi:PEP-CTERM motif